MTQIKASETEIRQAQVARALTALAGARERVEDTNRQIAIMTAGLRVAQGRINEIDAAEFALRQSIIA